MNSSPLLIEQNVSKKDGCSGVEKNESKKAYNNVALERYLDLMLNRAFHKLNLFKRISILFVDSNIRSFFSRKFKEKMKRNY